MCVYSKDSESFGVGELIVAEKTYLYDSRCYLCGSSRFAICQSMFLFLSLSLPAVLGGIFALGLV